MSPTKHLAVDPVGRALLEGMRRRYSVSNMSILEYVFAADRPCTVSEIVEATKLRPNTVASFLARETRKDIVEPVGRGVYQRSPRTRQLPQLNVVSDDDTSLMPSPKPIVIEPGAPLPPELRNFKLTREPKLGL